MNFQSGILPKIQPGFVSRIIGFLQEIPAMKRYHPVALGMLMLLASLGIRAADIQATILLQASPLAGFQYHAGKTLWPHMREGDALVLIREADNPHDANAVRVEWQGHQIGYVPRRENADVARFLDQGQLLLARITRLAESRDPWSRVRFDILIPLNSPAAAVR